jgi:hypothetical protein
VDVNDTLRARGGDAVRERIDAAKPYVPKTTKGDRPLDSAQHSDRSEEFPEPDDISCLNEPPAPNFPTECLPAVMRAWVEEGASALQAPAEMIAVPMIAVTAGCIGSGAAIELNRKGWQERCAMYCAVFAPKGSIKSPCLKHAIFPLSVIEREYREEWTLMPFGKRLPTRQGFVSGHGRPG